MCICSLIENFIQLYKKFKVLLDPKLLQTLDLDSAFDKATNFPLYHKITGAKFIGINEATRYDFFCEAQSVLNVDWETLINIRHSSNDVNKQTVIIDDNHHRAAGISECTTINVP